MFFIQNLEVTKCQALNTSLFRLSVKLRKFGLSVKLSKLISLATVLAMLDLLLTINCLRMISEVIMGLSCYEISEMPSS